MISAPSLPVSHAKNTGNRDGSMIHKPEGDSDQSEYNLNLRRKDLLLGYQAWGWWWVEMGN